MADATRQHCSAPLPACRTPFDPIVHDRQRFDRLWGDRVIRSGNLSVEAGELRSTIGSVDGRAPTEARFREELGAELARMRELLGLVG